MLFALFSFPFSFSSENHLHTLSLFLALKFACMSSSSSAGNTTANTGLAVRLQSVDSRSRRKRERDCVASRHKDTRRCVHHCSSCTGTHTLKTQHTTWPEMDVLETGAYGGWLCWQRVISWRTTGHILAHPYHHQQSPLYVCVCRCRQPQLEQCLTEYLRKTAHLSRVVSIELFRFSNSRPRRNTTTTITAIILRA